MTHNGDEFPKGVPRGDTPVEARIAGRHAKSRRWRGLRWGLAGVVLTALVVGGAVVLHQWRNEDNVFFVDPPVLGRESQPPAPPGLDTTPPSDNGGTPDADPEPDTTDESMLFVDAVRGDNANPGSAPMPFATVEYALDFVQPGDTIMVGGGDYYLVNDEIDVSVKGRADAWIRIVGDPDDRPRLFIEGWSTFKMTDSQFVEISGFELEGTSSVALPHGTGVLVIDSSDIRLSNNVIHGFGSGGISSIRSDRVIAENNEIFNTSKYSTYQTSGISFFQHTGEGTADGSYANVIRGNRIYRNENTVPGDLGTITDGNCIIIDDGRHEYSDNLAYPGSTLIENNVCFDNGGRGIEVLRSDNVVVMNNTLYHNGYSRLTESGELVAFRATNVVFRNNLVIAGEGHEPLHLVDASNISLDSNMYVGKAPHTLGPGDIVIDDAGLASPSTDPDSADFSLTAGSPAIDAGNPDGAPVDDVVGRIRDTVPDIGAHELQ